MSGVDPQAQENEVTLQYPKRFLQIATNIMSNQRKGRYEQNFKVFNVNNVQSNAFNFDDIPVRIDKWWVKLSRKKKHSNL